MVIDASPKPDLGNLSPLAREVASALSRVASNVALVVDASGRIVAAAEGSVPLRASCGAWEGLSWIDTVTGESRHKIAGLLDEVSRDGLTQPREVNHPTRSGVDIPLVWTAIRLGSEGLILAVGRDMRSVSEIQRRFMDAQHEMERDYWQRRHADARFHVFFHADVDALIAVDAGSLAVLETNEAARALLGDRGLAAGRRLMSLLPPAARPAVSGLLSGVRASGRPAEVRVALSEGGTDCDLAATPITVGDWSGLLLRGRRPAQGAGHAASAPRPDDLTDLTDRLGQTPLEGLLVEATRRAERQLVQAALQRCNGLIVPAAALLGIEPETLLARLRRLGLETPENPLASKLN